MSLLISKVFTYDTDAGNYIQAVEAADGQVLEGATRQAINNFVMGCKNSGVWDSAAQILLLSGARTLTGALVPLKGPAPTNNNFVSGNYNRKTGLGAASNGSKYLTSNVAVTTLGAYSHALFAYGSITGASGDVVLIGRYDGANYYSLISLDEWAAYVGGRAFRSGTYFVGDFPLSSTASAVSCMIGSRTSSTSATLYADGNSFSKSTDLGLNGSAQPLFIFSLNNNGSPITFSTSILQTTGIFSTGLTATQAAALRTDTTTMINAFAAAIP